MKFGPVEIEAAEGVVLAHTIRLPSGSLRKGHRVSAGDVAMLRDAGVASVIAATLEAGDIGEDEAASCLAALMAGNGIAVRSAATGRVNLHAEKAGVLVVGKATVDAFNAVDPSITLATLPHHASVVADQMVATVKIIPFAVHEAVVAAASRALGAGAMRLHPFRSRQVGLIQTELPSVKPSVLDKTARVTQARLDRSGSRLVGDIRTEHATADVARAIAGLDERVDLILIFGASAVCDAEDVIPAAIRLAGGIVERIGMPVDPGNLLVLGRIGGKPVIGAPGCARSPKLNGFDWVLDRLVADVPITSADIAGMGVGGLLMEIPTRPQPREPKNTGGIRVDAVLLAAGRATRMGGPNKLLARFDGIPLVRKLANEIVGGGVRSLVVVTGHQADRVSAALEGLERRIVTNLDYETGLASSLKVGLEALPADCDGALVCLGDMPRIRSEHVRQLLEAFVDAGGRAVVRASAGGSPGNPVILPRALFVLAQTLGGDRGAKRLIEEAGLDIVDVDIGEAAMIDVDTPLALAEAGGEVSPADDG
jgi:molybdenum cofactor cytidylyltransferase